MNGILMEKLNGKALCDACNADAYCMINNVALKLSRPICADKHNCIRKMVEHIRRMNEVELLESPTI